jgi:hypothetical protein
MKSHFYSAIFVSAISIFGSYPAAAAVVFDAGAPDLGGVYYADNATDGTAGAVAIPITFASNTLVNGANFWGGCYPATTCGSANITLSVYSATSSGPGSLLLTENFGSANQTATGKLIGGSGGFDEYAYSVSFSPILAPAGIYYLAISDDPSSGRFGVETTSNPPLGAVDYQKLTSTDPFGTIPANLALDLTYTAAVPEPSTWAMMIIGFLGLGWLSYRQRTGGAPCFA